MTEIYPANPEWNYILFRLQVILADPSIDLLSVTKYSNNFDPKHQPHMKVDVAIEATNYCQAEIDSLKFGNQSKYIFEAGHISIPERNSRSSNNKRTMLLYKLAINESMPIHKSGIDSLATMTDFPPEIDTIYVSDSKEELNIYPHRFKVKNKSQICFEYEVKYTSRGRESMKKWDQEQIMCEYCGAEPAKYYCKEDKQIYCLKCFEDSHRSSRKKNHNREAITPYNSSSYCTFHAHERLIHYCFECRELKCQKCLTQEMSKIENKHKENIELAQLAIIFKEKEAMFMEEAKGKTKGLLMKVQTKIKSLSKNYENQKKDLQDKFAAKLTKVREESNINIGKCVAVHAELKRKLDQFIWLQNFMGYCENFMLADDSIRMKEAFSTQIEKLTSREYYQTLERKIDDSSIML